MEHIKIKGSDQCYEIQSITKPAEHILQIVFKDAVPEDWGEIQLYTAGGILATILEGWTTVYRSDGQTIYLSDDGSVYQPPDPDTGGEILPSEPYVPTLEELQAAKKREISQACETAIYSGVDVTLTDGSMEHFSLTEHDQLNLFGKQVQLAAGTTELEYHADGQPCRYYSAKDMQIITSMAMAFVSYHTTYCNAVNMWITGCTTDEIQQIYYGADVPEQYQSDVLKAYIATAKESAGDENAQAAE